MSFHNMLTHLFVDSLLPVSVAEVLQNMCAQMWEIHRMQERSLAEMKKEMQNHFERQTRLLEKVLEICKAFGHAHSDLLQQHMNLLAEQRTVLDPAGSATQGTGSSKKRGRPAPSVPTSSNTAGAGSNVNTSSTGGGHPVAATASPVSAPAFGIAKKGRRVDDPEYDLTSPPVTNIKQLVEQYFHFPYEAGVQGVRGLDEKYVKAWRRASQRALYSNRKAVWEALLFMTTPVGTCRALSLKEAEEALDAYFKAEDGCRQDMKILYRRMKDDRDNKQDKWALCSRLRDDKLASLRQ